ncbi:MULTISPECIES: aspartate carbamoyltransferase [Alcaligenes]|jgi:aspartate carbamoyltransferase catalytic subunit|uniref:Aspartate carbamoyltransferase n=2 Tax=Alcaligenes TaxID=507 RepID=A0A3G2HVH2_9BURK|nr:MULTISPECIES: aspartate carbamoyltransferase [Alcaligenes]ASR89944.1 aspartate carbamoyltransferase [Alcaligenes faecalis]AWG34754.1 aspartate carbamoyltransferase [Alcaligenes aquatilis]AYN21162.1 aspartate carbamoyltransferase [Alcaligenes aquatilis]MCC9162323.1 aspartate carbamoyltransferase [Alcaligenes sp. MMA]MCH4225072.1 aspartate carbamoyltransferase [Alcaligenes faecalis]
MAVSQQVFLRDAMRRLNLTRDVFAARIGVKRRALDTWLLPEGSLESRAMPEVVQRFVTEIVENEALLSKYAQSAQSGPLRDRIATGGKHQLLSVDQFTRETVEELCSLADIMQPIARRQKVSRVLEGAVLGNLFFEASTRTRVSFGSAFCRLGGSVCDTTGFTFSSMAKGESIYDTSRVMSGYVDAMVIRHPEQGSVAEFARATNIPVVNGGDGAGEHPSQALLDLYTISTEFSRLGKLLDGAHIALVGDLKYGRTVHSLIKLLGMYRGLKFTLISPPGLEMPEHIVEQVAKQGKHVIEQTSSLEKGLPGVDVIYATRVQKERFEEGQDGSFTADFQVNKAIIDRCCGPDVIVMHPLPRDSREGAHDLSVDLNHDPRLAIFRQADNGIPVRMAIFAVLLGVETLVQHSMRDVTWDPPSHVGPDDAVFHGMY